MVTIEQINSYFANLNPVAEKIAFDISEVKAAYDHVWFTLKSTEQDDILNDTMMKPEIATRYNQNILSFNAVAVPEISEDMKKKPKPTKCQKFKNNYYNYDKKSLNTFNIQKVGLKMIHDETIGDYRDEHSFPFSYKTQSQINLSVIVSNSSICVSGDSDQVVNESSIAPIMTVNSNQKMEDTGNQSLIQNKTTTEEFTYLSDDDHDQKTILSDLGSKNTRQGSLTYSTENDSEDSTKDEYAEKCKLLPEKVQIPKGFDFLSNW